MDAARLGFPGEHFDAVMCVEAAFHFDTRTAFLSEAHRVLKPGGTLISTDMLFRAFMKPVGEFGRVPRANFVPDIAGYRAGLEGAGFENVCVEDATEVCLRGFERHLLRWPGLERRQGRMGFFKSIAAAAVSRGIAQYFRIVCKAYWIASARKPLASSLSLTISATNGRKTPS